MKTKLVSPVFVESKESPKVGDIVKSEISEIDYERTPIPSYTIGKPLEAYCNNGKHSQDRCMGFIDGYNTRRFEESLKQNSDDFNK